MNSALLFLLVIGYLGLLFFVAFSAERSKARFWRGSPYIYALSLAVYCSAWTYYGSIGVAADSGLEYLAIYTGPVIIIPAWIYLNKKIIRISRVHKISSIADFIALRYGNHRFLGALVAVLCILAITPYIALQIKAVSESFHLMTNTPESRSIFSDTATYVVLIIAGFCAFYGTRYADASEKRIGIVSAVAFESFLKLIFMLILGIYVVYGIFNGFNDLYSQAAGLPDFKKLNTINGLEGAANFLMLTLLSISAIFVLPRQFHTAIIENRTEKHVNTAIWLFPLYLLLINIFVFPIAWGGKVLFAETVANPEFFPLLIPQQAGNTLISVLIFFGGLSASISMIIISSIALSIMLSNNLIIPYGWLDRFSRKSQTDNAKSIVKIRRFGIFLLIISGFIYYKYFIVASSLFSIGMISFVIIAQLAPAFFGAVFWRRATYRGALAGILGGTLLCYLALVLPMYLPQILQSQIFNFFKIPYLSPVSATFFWSMVVNLGLYAAVSVAAPGHYRERNYAEIFVDIDDYIQNHENAYIWKGSANISDIRKILVKFLGEKKTGQALRIFNTKYNIDDENDSADSRFIKFSENLLSGRIGTASAKILLETVTKEDKITLPEVLDILEESRENISLNKQLTEKSRQLEKISGELQHANRNLRNKDRQKDEFLNSVTHELRTPLTAIRATSEILLDDEEMPQEIKKEFLSNIISESDRLAEIINDILYLDQLEAGKIHLKLEPRNLAETYAKALAPLKHLLDSRGLKHTENIRSIGQNNLFDEGKIIQVFHNILGNAIKFAGENGEIHADFINVEEYSEVRIFNSGPKIPDVDLPFIFEKFYQSKDQNLRKPAGSGLGLAISKKITEAHGGRISVQNRENGVEFCILLPIINEENEEDTHRG